MEDSTNHSKDFWDMSQLSGNDINDLADTRSDTVRTCAIIFSVISGASSLLVLFLIKKKGDYNTHMTLVWWMSAFQLLYDATFVPSSAHTGDLHWPYYFGQFCQNTFGLLSSFITNVIAGVLYIVIMNRKAFDLVKYWRPVVVITYLPVLFIQVAVVWAICTNPERNLNTVNRIYYFLRVISIFLNFLLCSMAYYQLVLRMNHSFFQTYTDILLRTLIKRTAFYPIVQALTRLPACYYEWIYSWNSYTGQGNQSQYISAILWVIFTPSAGAGYLAIYLVIAPGSRQNLQKLLFVDFPAFFTRGDYSGFLEPWKNTEDEASKHEIIKKFNAEVKVKSSIITAHSGSTRSGRSNTSGSLKSAKSTSTMHTGGRGGTFNAYDDDDDWKRSLSRTDRTESLKFSSGRNSGRYTEYLSSMSGSESVYQFQGHEVIDNDLLQNMKYLEEEELFETMHNIDEFDDAALKLTTGRTLSNEVRGFGGGVSVMSPFAHIDEANAHIGVDKANAHIGVDRANAHIGEESRSTVTHQSSGQITSFSLSSSSDDGHSKA